MLYKKKYRFRNFIISHDSAFFNTFHKTRQSLKVNYRYILKGMKETLFVLYLALWRVLVVDKWRRFAPPNKHAP